MAGAADSLLEPRPPARAAVKTLHCTVWITLQHSPSAWFDYFRLQQEEKKQICGRFDGHVVHFRRARTSRTSLLEAPTKSHPSFTLSEGQSEQLHLYF